MFPSWEIIYALVIGQLIIACFDTDSLELQKFAIIFGSILSVCWFVMVSINLQYSIYRSKVMDELEDELVDKLENEFKMTFRKASPPRDDKKDSPKSKKDSPKSKKDSPKMFSFKKSDLKTTWFYRRVVPFLLFLFWVYVALVTIL